MATSTQAPACTHSLKHTHSHRRNVWECPSGYLCNLRLKLVRGQGASRPRRLKANSGEAARLLQRSKIPSTFSTLPDMHEQHLLPCLCRCVCRCVCGCVCRCVCRCVCVCVCVCVCGQTDLQRVCVCGGASVRAFILT